MSFPQINQLRATYETVYFPPTSFQRDTLSFQSCVRPFSDPILLCWTPVQYQKASVTILLKYIDVSCVLPLYYYFSKLYLVILVRWELLIKNCRTCFPADSDSKESAFSAGDPGSIPGLGRSPGGGNSSQHQYSCLENSTDRGASRATIRGIAESDMTERLTLSLSAPAYQAPLKICWNFHWN